MPPDLLRALTAHVTATAHAHARDSVSVSDTERPCPCPAGTLTARDDTTVVHHAGTVAKAHAPGTDRDHLTPRLGTAAHLPGILLPPLAQTPVDLRGRLVTHWPHGTPVDPDDPDAAPWEAAATLLARLHRTPPPVPLPPMRGPVKAAHAVAALRATAPGHPATAPVLHAWATLPAWARGEAPMPDTATLCHGDFHLGQLVRPPAVTPTPALAPAPAPAREAPWLLIDIDDLGTGVPAWDLARPAAWYACGLLAPDEWHRFLTAYRTARGPAVPPDGDPWTTLDVPARALTAQTAARAVAKAVAADRPLDEVERSLVDACARMEAVRPSSPPD
ncbi:phosphotransferase [Streptomyces pilosus]|uniref:phosphotransferase n=1 Tax=Streptomyces pilosus TaxID=28893 RepID=UPI00363ED09E